ncbi:MAG TPA: YcnI family protein [Rubrobacteraceae bacterium]|nr:YcnI family protein [Rubrobacteraceae bacterium]
MRTRWLWVLPLTICFIIAAAGVAWAHVVLSPKQVPANSYQKLAVSVPTEKDIPTTKIRVEVPEGFTVTGVQPVPSWQYEFERDQGLIKAITWSGGEIRPQEFQEFPLQAKTPKDTGDYSWKAYQTYEDDSVVEWTGPPDAEEPASVVSVVSDSSQLDNGDRAGESGSPTAQGSAGGFTPIAAYTGLGLGALALALALLVALLVLRRRRQSP